MRTGRCQCPACGKNLAPKTIHEHTTKCVAWRERYGEPFPYFKFNGQPSLYGASAVEGQDYVQCKVCLEYGWDFRFRRMMDHLTGLHGMDEPAYRARYGAAPIRLTATTEVRKRTVRDRYGVDNVFQSEAVKAATRQTMKATYGAENPMQVDEIREKAAQTNQGRYGAANPFGSQEVQEKIRQGHLERYGVANPNQSPVVMERRIQTNQQRYGANHYLETPEFKEKFRQTSLGHFGTDHPMQSQEVQDKLKQVFLDKYGVSNPLSVPAIHQRTQETSRANHGGVHHLSDPTVIEARKKNLLERYGVDNISKVPAIKEKIVARLKECFRDGAIPKMTTPERLFQKMVPERVVYSGDFSYWVTWANGRHKNPDFVVLTEEQYAAYQAGVPLNDLRTYLVVEVNGVFWHTIHKGLTREEREAEFVSGYGSVGVGCLVVWEDDLELASPSLQERISQHLNGSHSV